MKFTLIIDSLHEEEVIVYAHKKTALIEQIEQLSACNSPEIIGFENKTAVKLDVKDIHCFICEDNKIYALTENKKYRIKMRLYILEEQLGSNFIKINQSCIANISMLERFVPSVYGSVTAVFKNGYTDYISRRNLKNVKERLGI